MAWFDPLNNSGGVSFDFFDFTYLSIPPNNKRILSQSIQIAFTKPNNQPQLHSQTNLLDHPYDWSLVSFRIETQYSIGSKMGLAGEELRALMPAELWHHVLFNFQLGMLQRQSQS